MVEKRGEREGEREWRRRGEREGVREGERERQRDRERERERQRQRREKSWPDLAGVKRYRDELAITSDSALFGSYIKGKRSSTWRLYRRKGDYLGSRNLTVYIGGKRTWKVTVCIEGMFVCWLLNVPATC